MPQDCPCDIWDLIQECLASQPKRRPTAKVIWALMRHQRQLVGVNIILKISTSAGTDTTA